MMSSGNHELVALIDFGNTLVDETFMWRDSDAFPDWTHHWSELMKAVGVLVDNISTHVERWRAEGGQGYVFTDDEQFARDMQLGLVPGFDAS